MSWQGQTVLRKTGFRLDLTEITSPPSRHDQTENDPRCDDADKLKEAIHYRRS
jgi:hypothetical protein